MTEQGTNADASDRLGRAPGRLVAGLSADERRFWIALGCVAVVHVALIAGAVRAKPRMMGEPTGSRDGISVEIVDAADLDSRNTVVPEPPAAPSPQPEMARPPEPPPQPAPAPQPQPPQQAEPAKPTPPAPKTSQPAAKPTPPAAKQSQPSIEDELPPLHALLDLEGKRSPATPTPPPQPAQPTPPAAKSSPPAPQRRPLDLGMPDFASFGRRSAAVMRPPGATRSGENDAFGRGVIQALRRTMPQSGDLRGRVTVRLFLSDKGNLKDVTLVRSGGDPILDQNVVFAVKQASFPIPPVGATPADLTFLVTYIYN